MDVESQAKAEVSAALTDAAVAATAEYLGPLAPVICGPVVSAVVDAAWGPMKDAAGSVASAAGEGARTLVDLLTFGLVPGARPAFDYGALVESAARSTVGPAWDSYTLALQAADSAARIKENLPIRKIDAAGILRRSATEEGIEGPASWSDPGFGNTLNLGLPMWGWSGPSWGIWTLHSFTGWPVDPDEGQVRTAASATAQLFSAKRLQPMAAGFRRAVASAIAEAIREARGRAPAPAPARPFEAKQVMAQQFAIPHTIAAKMLADAWQTMLGTAPTVKERQAAQAIAFLETRYGSGKARNNWGGLQCSAHKPPCQAGHCVELADKHADGTPYAACFRVFDSPIEGAQAFVKALAVDRPGVRVALASGNVDTIAHEMRRSHYFEADEQTYADAIDTTAFAIAGVMGEPLALSGAPEPDKSKGSAAPIAIAAIAVVAIAAGSRRRKP